MTRRTVDIIVSAAGLIIGAPFFLVIAAAVMIDAGWPVLFRQTRVGRGLRRFTLLKFRTMRMGHGGGPLTPSGHSAVTRTGAFLRATKLDELPQFWNVLKGEMSIIGSRPELLEFVERHRDAFIELLREKPGLIDTASVAYFDEAALLAKSADPVVAYERDILPAKLALSTEYQKCRTFQSDVRLIAAVAALCTRNVVSVASSGTAASSSRRRSSVPVR